MPQPELTLAAEDYLKTIYELTREGERATTSLLAERLNIRPASVTGMVQKLAEQNPALVDYQKHKGSMLTEAGRLAALRVIRRHRLLELYLHEELAYSWDEVHEEAERLEHVISDELTERMANKLGQPQKNPHGQPIPSQDLQVKSSSSRRLWEMKSGEQGRIQRVLDDDTHCLRQMDALGLRPGVAFAVVSSPAGKIMELILSESGAKHVLAEAIAIRVFVVPELGD